ncbi:histidine-type phosphatase [Macrococcus caseolyticus]|nr:histidine-type phosphatase [Macrococcus caseolyticus]RKO09296.1 histidine-type phosphatase [Macrococcus caseolyticus]
MFLNETRTVLLDGPEKGLPLYFNFAHDTDIINLLAAMGIDEVDEWNGDEVQFGQKWDATDLTPQGAHIVFERLIYKENASVELDSETKWASEYPAAFNLTQNLTAEYSGNSTQNSTSQESNVFVRVVLNEAVVPLKNCSSGPGYSCPLNEFNDWVDNRLSQIPVYNEFCNLPEGAPKYLEFWWNYNTTTDLDTSTSLSYQKGLVSWDDKPIKE